MQKIKQWKYCWYILFDFSVALIRGNTISIVKLLVYICWLMYTETAFNRFSLQIGRSISFLYTSATFLWNHGGHPLSVHSKDQVPGSSSNKTQQHGTWLHTLYANMTILHWNSECNSVSGHAVTTSLEDLNALTNFPQDEEELSASKSSTFCRSFLLSLPAKLPPCWSSFFTLHALSHSTLCGHIASSVLILLAAFIGWPNKKM